MSKKSINTDSTRYYLEIDIWRHVGAALIIGGLVWFWLGRSMIAYYVSGVFVPVGLVLFLIFSGRHISDNDMEEEQTHRMLGYDSSVTNRNDFSRYVLKQPADVETAAYHMGERAAYFKRGKNSTVVSDRYVKTHFFFTRDGLVISSRELSMTLPREDENAHFDLELTIPYHAVALAAIEENQTSVVLSNTKKAVTTKWVELVIKGQEEELVRLPVNNDMAMSSLCEMLNRKVQ